MAIRTASSRRLLPVLATATVLLAPLAACSGTSAGSGTAQSGAAASATATTGGSGAGGSAGNGVRCSGTSCSVTLSANQQAEVLGTSISLGSVQNGRATLGVAGKNVSCAQGEKVSAGPLQLTCSAVTSDSVTLSASLG